MHLFLCKQANRHILQLALCGGGGCNNSIEVALDNPLHSSYARETVVSHTVDRISHDLSRSVRPRLRSTYTFSRLHTHVASYDERRAWNDKLLDVTHSGVITLKWRARHDPAHRAALQPHPSCALK